MRTLTAVVLLWALVPGSIAAAADLTHAAIFGHAMHADAERPSHEGPDPEHGCTATFHLCSCHSAPTAVAVSARNAAPLKLNSGQPCIIDFHGVTDDCRFEVFHPPRS